MKLASANPSESGWRKCSGAYQKPPVILPKNPPFPTSFYQKKTHPIFPKKTPGVFVGKVWGRFLVRIGDFLVRFGGLFGKVPGVLWKERGGGRTGGGGDLFQTPDFLATDLKPTNFWWPLELGIETHESTKMCGPSSWGYGLPHFDVAPRVGDMDSHASVWPLELGIWTPTPIYLHNWVFGGFLGVVWGIFW